MLRPIESYSGACACAAAAPNDKATSTPANPHFMNPVDDTRRARRQSSQPPLSQTGRVCGICAIGEVRARAPVLSTALTLQPKENGGAFRHRRPISPKRETYFSEVETLSNVELSLVPMLVIAPIAATAIKAAIRPYSMAVAPFSFLISFKNLAISGLRSAIS